MAVVLLGAFGCREAPPPPPVPLAVLASSSLAEYAREAAAAFEETANVAVEVRTGGTHELAAELASGRAADLLLTTGVDWMDELEEEGLIVPESRWEEVGNRMVLLGRKEARYPDIRLVDVALLKFKRLIISDPSRDAAGGYARSWLQGVGLRNNSVWRQLEDRLETVSNIQEVLEAIAGDPSAVGVVFASDLGHVPNGEVLARSRDLRIRHPFALVERPARPPEARELLEFLQSPAGIELLQINGFLTDEKTEAAPDG